MPLLLALALFAPSASRGDPGAPAPSASTDAARAGRIVARARLEVERGVSYDPAYASLRYRDGREAGSAVFPGGDVDPGRGVCTDVVIRALRAADVDLQSLVHRDILARPDAYPGVRAPDANIDHRRVGPLLAFFRAHAVAARDDDWRPGDIVVWSFRPAPHTVPAHVGIVSDRRGPRGLPLVIHNLGPAPTEDDSLDAWTRLGHFRM